MKWIKLTAVLLLLSLVLSCIAGGSTATPALTPSIPTEPSLSMPPTTQVTSVPTSEPTSLPTTEATQEPTTEPVTEPITEPVTEPPTQPATKPTKPTTPKPTDPPEPWSSQDVTIGEEIAGITAKKAFVYDCESRSYLYMKSEADAKLYPASITKLMNVYTALKYLDKDTVITVDEGMLSIVPGDTSKAGLYKGQQLTVENLLKGVLMASGSDAAHILGVFAGRVITGDPQLPAQEAEDAFVVEMNNQAQTLGLVNTHFVNCDGYTNYYHYTCMADLVTIANICLDTPLIRDTVKNAQARMYFTNGKYRTVTSTNFLLRKNSSFYRSEAVGMKTGTTDAAGACLLSVFQLDGRHMIIGVFGCPTYNSRYNNVLKLFDRYKNYAPPVVEPDPTEPTTGVTSPPTEEPSTVPTEPITIPTEPVTTPTEPPTEVTTTPATEETTLSTEVTEAPTEQPTETPSTEYTTETGASTETEATTT
ncbi:MAG: hypothetical protein J6K03_04780 [Oscillospiraceae bacterium]|nr:hypothetical protein [Oscillospiraceae bacterium]